MPVKHILTRGVGFSPASIKYMVTHGLSIGAVKVSLLWTPKGGNSTTWVSKTDATSVWTPKGDNSTTWTAS